MAGEWPILTVAECASSEPYSTQIGPFGEKIRAENYTVTGAPVLRGTNVNPEGRFHDDDFVFIDSLLLTHNWEFFVQIQTTLNKAQPDSHLSVLVLENCTAISDYSEKSDEIKAEVASFLAAPGEPSKARKEEIAGKLRRLIEAVVNTQVFNGERHQYKQKTQQITAFQRFTKVVALLATEATALRDLYEKLSITEHDHPRNAYVNTDKAMFQTRYNQILAIEAAVAARRP
jgi:hypothetical protein